MKLVTEKKAHTSKVETETPVEAVEKKSTEAAPATSNPVAASTSSGGSSIDWSGIEGTTITLFYPGQSSLEWVLKGSDHGGKRAFTKGDRCFECHEDEESDIGELIISGEKLEPTPIPGKRAFIPVKLNDYGLKVHRLFQND